MFKFNLSYEDFRKIYPKICYYKNKGKKKKYKIMKPKAWVNVIKKIFLKKHKFMCIFVNEKRYVDMNTNRSKHYLIFKAKCKDKNCGVDLFGWCDSKPIKGEPLEVSFITRNTEEHETQNLTRIPLNYEKLITKKYLKTNFACNQKSKNITDIKIDQFSTSDDVQRKVVLHIGKEDTVNTNLKILNKCPIQSLLEHKYNSNYCGSIHSISFDPFIVHYWSSNQLVIYTNISKTYRKLFINVTSGLIKKLERTSLNLLSDDIFLYEFVMSTSFGYIPVAQMISEKYDTLTIFYWISQWMACGINGPNEVVCDFSKVLISAVSRAFCNGNSLHTYNENCFKALLGYQESLPPCYIHINVAHIMKIFCKIKCLSQIRNKNVKEFYIQSLKLISTCESLSEFDIILEALLTVILSKTDGRYDENGRNKTAAEEKREFILNRIRGLYQELSEFDINMSEDEFVHNIKNTNSENHNDERETSQIASHIKTIYEKSKINASVKGYRLSEYFLPELATFILDLCNDFPLWTNVMKLKFNSPYDVASSIVTEKYFKELKNQIFKFNVHPMSADQFIITYLNSIKLNSKILYSSPLSHSLKLNSQHMNNKSAISCFSTLSVIQNKYSNECYDSEKPLVDFENWCGQDNNNQMISEIHDLPLKNQSTTKSLLINGNYLTPVIIGENKYFVINTCAFDSVAVIIAMAYIDNPNYKITIDASNDKFLTFCKELTTNSISAKTYVDRGTLLKGIFPEHQGVNDVKLINSKCNVSFIITSLLKNIPSASEHIFCSNLNCINYSKIISCPSIIVQLTKGFESLEVDLHYYIMCRNKYKCTECNGIIKSSRDLHGHLFIETDVDGDQRQFKLNDFPIKIEIKNTRLVRFYTV